MNDEKLKQFRRLYARRTDKELADYFGISVSKVEDLATKYALGKDKQIFPNVAMPHWTEQEEERLREIYPDQSNLEIARALGRTRQSIANKAKRLGLLKSAPHRTKVARQNCRLLDQLEKRHTKESPES